MQDYRKLKVWERAHALTLQVYRITARFPADERIGLTSQARRCCVSIAANIAEGSGRGSPKDFVRFLKIASGSANELEYYLILCTDLGFVAVDVRDKLQTELSQVRRMLSGLMRSILEAA